MKQQNNITSILQGRLSIVLLLLVLILTSCNNEKLQNEEVLDGNSLEISIALPQAEQSLLSNSFSKSVAGSSLENVIKQVVIFVFNADGTKLENILAVDTEALPAEQTKWATTQTLIVPNIIQKSFSKKIYVVTNWRSRAEELSAYTEATLKEELTEINNLTEINDLAKHPILMSGSVGPIKLTTTAVSVTVKRQLTKLKAAITLSKQTQTDFANIEWLTDQMQLIVLNTPNQSYLIERGAAPAKITLFNSDVIAVNDVEPATGSQTLPTPTNDLKWEESVYLYENPFMGTTDDKNKVTRIVVQLPYKNRKTATIVSDNCYEVNINNTSDGTNPHKMLRNTIYTLFLRIDGQGLPVADLIPNVNVGVNLSVDEWKEQAIDADVSQNYFNVDKTLINFEQPGLTKSVITLSTDIPNWTLSKDDGTIILPFANGQSGPTTIDGLTYTTAGTALEATITIEMAPDASFVSRKLYFKDRNIKRTLTINNDNGVISNAVLVASGWKAPANRPVGLQISKRGSVLPTKIAASNERTGLKWGPEGVEISSNFQFLNLGESNTTHLASLGAEYELATYCKNMEGGGWYLPSIDELLLIHKHKELLGVSYAYERSRLYASSSVLVDEWDAPRYQAFYWAYHWGALAKIKDIRFFDIAVIRCVKNI